MSCCWGDNDCACYERGWNDAMEEGVQRAEDDRETPLLKAVLGSNRERVSAWRIRDCAEGQADRGLRHWLLSVADAVEQIEDRWEEAGRQEQERLRDLARQRAEREAAIGAWPG